MLAPLCAVGKVGIEHDCAVGHKPFHRLHNASLSARMIELGILALCGIPRHQREPLPWLPFFKAGNIAQGQHPPVIRIALLPTANIAVE